MRWRLAQRAGVGRGARELPGARPVFRTGKVAVWGGVRVEDYVRHLAGLPLVAEEREQLLCRPPGVEVGKADGYETGVPAPLVRIQGRRRPRPAPHVVAAQDLRRLPEHSGALRREGFSHPAMLPDGRWVPVSTPCAATRRYPTRRCIPCPWSDSATRPRTSPSRRPPTTRSGSRASATRRRLRRWSGRTCSGGGHPALERRPRRRAVQDGPGSDPLRLAPSLPLRLGGRARRRSALDRGSRPRTGRQTLDAPRPVHQPRQPQARHGREEPRRTALRRACSRPARRPAAVIVLHLGGAYEDRPASWPASWRPCARRGRSPLPGTGERRADLDRRRDRRDRPDPWRPGDHGYPPPCLNPGHLSLEEALDLALPTWELRGVGRSSISLARTRTNGLGRTPTACDVRDWRALLDALDGRDTDVMVEAKGKEQALVSAGDRSAHRLGMPRGASLHENPERQRRSWTARRRPHGRGRGALGQTVPDEPLYSAGAARLRVQDLPRQPQPAGPVLGEEPFATVQEIPGHPSTSWTFSGGARR